jgi:hypothetical protein
MKQKKKQKPKKWLTDEERQLLRKIEEMRRKEKCAYESA